MKNTVFFLSLFAVLITRVHAQPVPLHKEQQREVIEQIGRLLTDNYIFKDTAAKMSAFIRNQFSSGAYDSLTRPNILAARLRNDLLSIYHDGHLNVRYTPGMAASLGNSNELSKEDQAKVLETDREHNFGFNKVEILDGNIGYIKFNLFAMPGPEAKETAHNAFRFIQHTRALILDLRDNGGGDPDMVRYICNWLFKERTHLNDLYIRREHRTIEFWTEPDAQLTSLTTIPLYILTSQRTFSGAEEFAYDLQTRKRCVVIGETTGGGAHPVEPRDAGNGFVLFVPFARAINPVTKTNWEGTGVHPDIPVPAVEALDTAIAEAGKRLAAAKQ